MSPNKMSRRTATALISIVLFAVGLAGCAQDLERRETMALHAGDAVARNKIAHIIDPWPAHAGRTRIHTDAKRMTGVIEDYRNPPVEEASKPTDSGTIKLNLSGTSPE